MVPIRANSWSYKIYNLGVWEVASLLFALVWLTGSLLLGLNGVQRIRAERRIAGKVSTRVRSLPQED